jgi:precorrin-2 dehydrogenase/sirohydrochlorin ferrochelatase
VTETIARWSKQGLVELQARRYRAGDTVGFGIVFAATDDPAMNDVVYRECRNTGAWINAADDPEHCDFILPSVLKRGVLTVTVSTAGHSPALARTIREELELYFTAEYEALVQLAAEVRAELRRRDLSVPFENWQRALSGDVRQLLMRGDAARARQVFLRDLGVMLPQD